MVSNLKSLETKNRGKDNECIYGSFRRKLGC